MNREAQRLARDIKRLRNLQDRNLSEKTREVLQWSAQNIGERLARMAGEVRGGFIREVNRPRRTDSQRQFIKAHDMLCRENGGAWPTYGAVHRKLVELLPRDCVVSIRTLRRINETLRLPMSGKVGRPKK